MNDEQQPDSFSQLSYLQKYGLTREPFAIDATSNQDDFFLLDSERSQRLNMLYHMCQNSELLLVVSGVKGSGKTSLLNKFIDMRTDNWRQCVINVTAMTNPDNLLIEIAEGFGLPQDSVNFGSGLEMLQKRLTEMKRSELMPILIIDDAHELPTASLTILLKLSELSEADERLLRIVLFGEPAINDMFNAPELKEVKHRITHTLTMPALDEKQSIEYIQYRLSIAGLQNDSPFTTSQMKRIHRQANGVPGLINQFAQEILVNTTANKSNNSPSNFAVRLRSTVSILLILGIAASITWFLMRDMFDSFSDSQDTHSTKLETHDLPLLPPSTKISDQETKPNNKQIISSSTTFDALTGGDSTDEITTKNESIDTSTNNIITDAKPTTKTTIEVVEKTVSSLPDNTVADKSLTSPIAISSTEQTDTVAIIDNPAVTINTTEAKATVAIKKKPAVDAITKVNAQAQAPKSWLEQQNPQHFTLQLMGSRKRSSLSLVQRAHNITTTSAIIRTQLKGADWYILVHKSFATKQLAREGTKKLPKALLVTQPWPRQIKELQALK